MLNIKNLTLKRASASIVITHIGFVKLHLIHIHMHTGCNKMVATHSSKNVKHVRRIKKSYYKYPFFFIEYKYIIRLRRVYIRTRG